MQEYVVDTNFFLQHKDPEQQHWEEVTQEAEIVLLVPAAVQQELDRLKQDGSSRRAKRARGLVPRMREILTVGEAVLRESKPRVVLRLLDASPYTQSIRADDQIAFDAKSRGIPLLTADTYLAVTAKRLGAPYVLIPAGWELPPETDKQEKVNQELTRRLEKLEKEKQCPRLIVTATVGEQKLFEGRMIEVPYYRVRPARPEELDAQIQHIWNKIANRARPSRDWLVGSSSPRRERLQIQQGVEKRAREKEIAGRVIGGSIVVENVGTGPARDMHMEVSVGPSVDGQSVVLAPNHSRPLMQTESRVTKLQFTVPRDSDGKELALAIKVIATEIAVPVQLRLPFRLRAREVGAFQDW